MNSIVASLDVISSLNVLRTLVRRQFLNLVPRSSQLARLDVDCRARFSTFRTIRELIQGPPAQNVLRLSSFRTFPELEVKVLILTAKYSTKNSSPFANYSFEREKNISRTLKSPFSPRRHIRRLHASQVLQNSEIK